MYDFYLSMMRGYIIVNFSITFQVDPDDVPVTLSFPVPEKKCESKPIIIPRVRCEVKTEKKCVGKSDL